jgi:sugar O-acyltransferase (sialic acid O-acetyltransferase NeuD family)
MHPADFLNSSSPPNRVGLLGAGGQAREVASYLPPGTEVFWAVSAEYLNPRDPAHVDISSPGRRDRESWVVAAVGPPAVRRDMVAAWPGKRFLTILSPAAYVDRSCRVGAGSVIAPGAVLTVDVEIGEHCLVNVGATISHDVALSSFVTVGPGAHISGRVHLGGGVFVGVGASISNNVDIAPGVVIGAGATVLHDITTPNTVVVGVPARPIEVRGDWLDAL